VDRIDFGSATVRMTGITKRFGDLLANDRIDLEVHKGEVHALLGENGAGKTTLMKILYGLYRPSEGEIFVNGKRTEIPDPNAAIRHGIGMVHQHFMLVKPFTVAENIVLGRECVKRLGVLDMERARADVEELSRLYGLTVDTDAKIQDISVGMQQRVEILKALYRGADILILDEPTAVLTPQEIEELGLIVRNLTAQGKTVIIITHKLREIKQMADFCTVIRRGVKVGTVEVSKVSERELASMMVGREVNFKVDKEPRSPGEIMLEVKDLVVEDNRGLDAVSGLSLELRRGEILGVAGIDGNGQTEFVESLTGLRRIKSGTVKVRGEDVTNKPPRCLLDRKLSSIPEDRQKRGLILDFDVAENLILENYRRPPFARKGILLWDRVVSFAKRLIEIFDIRPAEERLKARSLSGGNQQKVIIAREVTNDPDILVAAQPTRGLDVGAIEYVHKALVDQRNKDKAVLLVSFELDEIMNVADRIAVLFEGKIVDCVSSNGVDEKTLGLMMAGGCRET